MAPTAYDDDTTLFGILLSYQQIYDEALQPVMAGQERTSLDLLLRGIGPADGNIATDFPLWADFMRSAGTMMSAIDVLIEKVQHTTSLVSPRDLGNVIKDAHDRTRMLY